MEDPEAGSTLHAGPEPPSAAQLPTKPTDVAATNGGSAGGGHAPGPAPASAATDTAAESGAAAADVGSSAAAPPPPPVPAHSLLSHASFAAVAGSDAVVGLTSGEWKGREAAVRAVQRVISAGEAGSPSQRLEAACCLLVAAAADKIAHVFLAATGVLRAAVAPSTGVEAADGDVTAAALRVLADKAGNGSPRLVPAARDLFMALSDLPCVGRDRAAALLVSDHDAAAASAKTAWKPVAARLQLMRALATPAGHGASAPALDFATCSRVAGSCLAHRHVKARQAALELLAAAARAQYRTAGSEQRRAPEEEAAAVVEAAATSEVPGPARRQAVDFIARSLKTGGAPSADQPHPRRRPPARPQSRLLGRRDASPAPAGSGGTGPSAPSLIEQEEAEEAEEEGGPGGPVLPHAPPLGDAVQAQAAPVADAFGPDVARALFAPQWEPRRAAVRAVSQRVRSALAPGAAAEHRLATPALEAAGAVLRAGLADKVLPVARAALLLHRRLLSGATAGGEEARAALVPVLASAVPVLAGKLSDSKAKVREGAAEELFALATTSRRLVATGSVLAAVAEAAPDRGVGPASLTLVRRIVEAKGRRGEEEEEEEGGSVVAAAVAMGARALDARDPHSRRAAEALLGAVPRSVGAARAVQAVPGGLSEDQRVRAEEVLRSGGKTAARPRTTRSGARAGTRGATARSRSALPTPAPTAARDEALGIRHVEEEEEEEEEARELPPFEPFEEPLPYAPPVKGEGNEEEAARVAAVFGEPLARCAASSSWSHRVAALRTAEQCLYDAVHLHTEQLQRRAEQARARYAAVLQEKEGGYAHLLPRSDTAGGADKDTDAEEQGGGGEAADAAIESVRLAPVLGPGTPAVVMQACALAERATYDSVAPVYEAALGLMRTAAAEYLPTVKGAAYLRRASLQPAVQAVVSRLGGGGARLRRASLAALRTLARAPRVGPGLAVGCALAVGEVGPTTPVPQLRGRLSLLTALCADAEGDVRQLGAPLHRVASFVLPCLGHKAEGVRSAAASLYAALYVAAAREERAAAGAEPEDKQQQQQQQQQGARSRVTRQWLQQQASSLAPATRSLLLAAVSEAEADAGLAAVPGAAPGPTARNDQEGSGADSGPALLAKDDAALRSILGDTAAAALQAPAWRERRDCALVLAARLTELAGRAGKDVPPLPPHVRAATRRPLGQALRPLAEVPAEATRGAWEVACRACKRLLADPAPGAVQAAAPLVEALAMPEGGGEECGGGGACVPWSEWDARLVLGSLVKSVVERLSDPHVRSRSAAAACALALARAHAVGASLVARHLSAPPEGVEPPMEGGGGDAAQAAREQYAAYGRGLAEQARCIRSLVCDGGGGSDALTPEQCAKVLAAASAHRSRAARDAAAGALGAFMDRDGPRTVLQGIAQAGPSLGQGGAALRELAEAMAAARVEGSGGSGSGTDPTPTAAPAHEVYTPDGAVSVDGGSVDSATPRSVGSAPSEAQLYPLQGGPVAGRRAARRQASSASLGGASHQPVEEESGEGAGAGARGVAKPWTVPPQRGGEETPIPFGPDSSGAHSVDGGRFSPCGEEGADFFGRPSLGADAPEYVPSRAFTRRRRPSDWSDGSGRAAFGIASASKP